MSQDDNTHKFSGPILDFEMGGVSRKYIMGAVRYGILKKFVQVEPFDAKTGKGEQRGADPQQSKKIAKAKKNGKFAPTAWTIGTREHHRKNIKIDGNKVTLTVNENDKLPILDGGNRKEALELLRSDGEAVDNKYVPFLLYLDGDPREDFVVLQERKAVGRDHMLSLRIYSGLLNKDHAPFFRLAKDTALTLHTEPDSFCFRTIQFDSSGTKLPISLNSICTKGASDLAFSLYGGAKITENFLNDEGEPHDSDWLANCILTAYRAIKQDPDANEALLSNGQLLCPAPDGSKTGTSMLIGLGNMLAARLHMKGIEEPEDEDLQLLIDCAMEHLDLPVSGNTSKDRKRKIFKAFNVAFFEDVISDGNGVLEIENGEEGADAPAKRFGAHEGIPVWLIRLLSPSAFDVSKLPSEGKKRGPKPVAVVAAAQVYDDSDSDEVEIEVDSQKFSDEDPIDAEAFAGTESSYEDVEGEAPWDEDDDSDEE